MPIKNRTPQKPMTDKERKEKQRAKPKALKLKKLHELTLDSVTFGKLEEVAKWLGYQQQESYSTQDIAKFITYCINLTHSNGDHNDIDSMADTQEAIAIYQVRSIAKTLQGKGPKKRSFKDIADTLREYDVAFPKALIDIRATQLQVENWLPQDVKALLTQETYEKMIEETKSHW